MSHTLLSVHEGVYSTLYTNTKNTPIEAFERAFPVRVLRYELRSGSGGVGFAAGGDGIVRDLELLEDVTVSLITERRVSQPWGLAGGEPGAVGENWVLPAGDGSRAERLPDKITLRLHEGDVLRVLTPGGGGWGTAPDVELRLATVDDVAAMQAAEDVAGELFRAVDDPRISKHADDPVYITEGLEQAVREGRAWVAVDHTGSVVGFAVGWVVDGEGHLDELAVVPAFGRRGIGRALVEEVDAWSRAQGLLSITLTTFRDVPWNAPYYERLGFHVVTELTPALEALLEQQAQWGLDPELRVVMRRSVV